ncbi:unnamed protein product [Toxocara canis]|uniref:Uncharacterized protein n=1 Tax=Toxocara canis TaxID=6265 RepID=A0A3P7GF11_TOXCA|nr:unnamed protein product [Toxocara canis]
MARTARSPWWSAVVDEAGVPVIQDHRLVYRLAPAAEINTY